VESENKPAPAINAELVITAFELGGIKQFTHLCEETRAHAYNRMTQHASEMGANGVIGMRYDATEIMSGVTEVLCYGTAVLVRVKPPASSTT
jgi:uncharacterized protein YbjQ (UPF0145 family)